MAEIGIRTETLKEGEGIGERWEGREDYLGEGREREREEEEMRAICWF